MARLLAASLLLILAACQSMEPVGPVDGVNVDGYRIAVQYLGGRNFSARGGEETKDKWVKYRQVRAVEITSLCRVKESHDVGGILRATVGCANPRTSLNRR
jgi:hypothetical protein